MASGQNSAEMGKFCSSESKLGSAQNSVVRGKLWSLIMNEKIKIVYKLVQSSKIKFLMLCTETFLITDSCGGQHILVGSQETYRDKQRLDFVVLHLNKRFSEELPPVHVVCSVE